MVYRSRKGGGSDRNFSQMDVAYYQCMRESLTISMYCISISIVEKQRIEKYRYKCMENIEAQMQKFIDIILCS